MVTITKPFVMQEEKTTTPEKEAPTPSEEPSEEPLDTEKEE